MELFIYYLGVIIIVSYLLGSIPFGFIIAKIFGKKDIRKEGSGSTGMTNVLRTTGKIPALITFILDAAKGISAILFTFFTIKFIIIPFILMIGMVGLFSFTNPNAPSVAKEVIDLSEPFVLIIIFTSSFFAILGHCYSPWLKFKGGKGFATTIGIIGVLNFKVLLIGLVIWLLTFLWKRYVSLATIFAVISFPISAYLVKEGIIAVYGFAVLSIFIIIMHGKNIKRLIQGKENRPTSTHTKNVKKKKKTKK
jgi:acyl phosphate:glycerol-3-phosphate acyltransferase